MKSHPVTWSVILWREVYKQLDYELEISIPRYIITQVILAFWLVLAYDLLEDRRTIDVIVTKFFPLCFKMAESFENLDNIFRDWGKDKVQKKSCRGIEQVRETRRRKIKPFLLDNDPEKILQQSQSAVERD